MPILLFDTVGDEPSIWRLCYLAFLICCIATNYFYFVVVLNYLFYLALWMCCIAKPLLLHFQCVLLCRTSTFFC